MEIEMNEMEKKLPSFSKNEMIEKVIEVLEKNDVIYACDLHHYAFNENYYIEDLEIAEQVVDNYGFKNGLKEVLEYEQTNFGGKEVLTNILEYIENPIKLASMIMYIKGEEFLYNGDEKVKAILDENWNEPLSIRTSNLIIQLLKENMER